MSAHVVLLAALLAASPPAAEPEVVDRLVAVVDEDPIFLSELERALALGMAGDAAAEDDPDRRRRRVLDRLVEQRLRSHEVDRYGFGRVPRERVDAQVEVIAERFGGRQALEAHLAALGESTADLRALVRRRLRVLAYIDERLAPRVFVEEEDVRAYYDGELAAELAARGLERPPLDEVRGAIRTLLRERALDAEIERWTDGLRRRADVVDLLDRDPTAEPPPVVWRSGDEP